MRMKCIIFLIFLQSSFCFGRLQQSDVFCEKARRLPQLDVCGKSIHPPGHKIIGGTLAVLGEYPWMAALGYRNRSYFLWHCGGSLITDQYVITAAHCVISKELHSYRLITVRLGLGELDLDETVVDGASPLDFSVSSWTSHPEYSDLKKQHDIGLIKLNRKVTFTNYIRPICLPPPVLRHNDYVGCPATIAGWGNNKPNGNTGLLHGEVIIENMTECKRNYTILRIRKTIQIDDNVLCASSYPVDSCIGDSGGPLMWYIRPDNTPPGMHGNTYLMGIVAYGYGCANRGYPGFYTRVENYRQWIIKNLDI